MLFRLNNIIVFMQYSNSRTSCFPEKQQFSENYTHIYISLYKYFSLIRMLYTPYITYILYTSFFHNKYSPLINIYLIQKKSLSRCKTISTSRYAADTHGINISHFFIYLTVYVLYVYVSIYLLLPSAVVMSGAFVGIVKPCPC